MLLIPLVFLLGTACAFFEQAKVHNANHIFNAVHSSMRQWGSTLNHNGMSFFLANIPSGTHLYHGSRSSEPEQGMEWLAFEPEHAIFFAEPPPMPPQSQHNRQMPLGDSPLENPADVGYLHTYAATHDLRLLYIDGMSAGKTPNGTLDTQDILLLNYTEPDPGGPLAREYERARRMCNLASTIWQGQIDGILRMESGFEIIMCNFGKHLFRTDMMAIKRQDEYIDQRGLFAGWPFMKAITERYDGIGGDRVRLDYNSMVSVFSYANVDGLFDNDVQSDYAMPRLQNVKAADLVEIRDDITKSILLRRGRGQIAENWQAVADMVITRYSQPLHYLHTNEQTRADPKAIEAYIANLLRPFIDYTARNSTLETQRCVAQIFQGFLSSRYYAVAPLAIHAVTYRICYTLLESLSVVLLPHSEATHTPDHLSTAIRLIDDLVDYLQWTTWKFCGTCPDEQICYTALWPVGTHEDHAYPSCKSEEETRERWGYWGYGDGR
jgi:hypothetical protein